MRSSTILLSAASSCLVQARWMRWTDNREAVGHIAQPTQASGVDESNGWTPKPTQAPGSLSASEAVLELLKRASSSSSSSSSANTWENNQSCGWYAGISSSAYTCDSAFTCATESNVVGCTSATFAQFYTECLNFAAVQQGACESVGAATGCCEASTAPACGTYIWTGSPTRSMYQCFATPTIISMNDEPQFVIDARTRTTASSSSSSSSSTSAASQTSVSTTSSVATSTATSSAGSGASPTPVGAIVGGVVGGLAFLVAAALAAYCYLRSKKKNTLKMSINRNKTTNKTMTTNNYSTKPRHNGRADSSDEPGQDDDVQGQAEAARAPMAQTDGRNARGAATAYPPSASRTASAGLTHESPRTSQDYYDPTRPARSRRASLRRQNLAQPDVGRAQQSGGGGGAMYGPDA